MSMTDEKQLPAEAESPPEPVEGGWIETPEPGIYPDIPAEVYHRWDAMSNSWLGILADECPEVLYWARQHPRPPTKAMRFGAVLHKLILEPFDFAKDHAVAPVCNRKTKAGKVIWAEFCDAAGERTVVPATGEHGYGKASGMAHAVRRHPTALQYLGGQVELSIVWDDPELKVRCKARLDSWDEPVIGDLKSTANAKPEVFQASSLVTYGYHRQAAFYSDGIKVLTGVDPLFIIVAVMKTPPYCVIARQVDPLMGTLLNSLRC